ncbi:MAG: TetR/AcrR family transcriptional regulator [Desulfobacteraceae bacterium]|jgi:TetR/AcrR family transcriptional repressor of nem operon
MTRPRRSDHLREDLLEKGIELLTVHGYHGTGLKQILDEVNVPKGSFYHYFASKEKFVAEVIERYSQKVAEQLDSYLDHTSDDPVTAIRNIHLYITQLLEKDPKGCLVGNLSAEMGNESPDCSLAMQGAIAEWGKRIVRLIQNAQNQKLMRRDVEADVLADILWNAWQGGLLRMQIEGSTTSLIKTLDALIGVLFV